MVAKSIAKMYTNIHKPTYYYGAVVQIHRTVRHDPADVAALRWPKLFGLLR